MLIPIKIQCKSESSVTLALIFTFTLFYSVSLFLQIALALQRMEAFSQTRNTKALIISGDFNTPPHYPAYQFIKEGQITADMEQSYEDKTPLHKLEPVRKYKCHYTKNYQTIVVGIVFN